MSFDETIIHCSAPALCGIKPASLFSMNSECYDTGRGKLSEWRGVFAKSGRYLVPLRKSDAMVLFFVFDKILLDGVLGDARTESYLKEKGYPVGRGSRAVLAELLHRLAFQESFPHEVGVFLGYPLGDVIAFERGEKNCKLAGLWKVYGGEKEAKRKMALYKSCTEFCAELIRSGVSVPASVQKFTGTQGK